MAMKKPQRAEEAAAIAKGRARGALYGLAVGDAFGAPHKGKRMNAPLFPKLADGPHVDMLGTSLLADVAYRLKPGQVTAETQMATCLAASLRAHKAYDPADTWKQYLAWYKQPPFDLPPMIAAVFVAHEAGGLAAQNPARYVWRETGRKIIHNGALARTAPIGVFFAKDEEARAQASLQDTALTHYDPRCQLASVAFNGAIAAAISAPTNREPKIEELVDGASLALSLGAPLLGKSNPELIHETQVAAELWRKEMENAARLDDPMLYGPDVHMHSERDTSSVLVAFRLAFWELFHAPSFEAALVDVVNRGGDTDANAAVTGALLGAFYGEKAVPERWKKAVMEALSGARGPIWETYHPRHLIPLADG